MEDLINQQYNYLGGFEYSNSPIFVSIVLQLYITWNQ